MNMHKQNWTNGLTVQNFVDHQVLNESMVDKMLIVTKEYNKQIKEEEGKRSKHIVMDNVGKINPKKHLKMSVN